MAIVYVFIMNLNFLLNQDFNNSKERHVQYCKSYRNIIPEFGSNHAVVFNEIFYFVEYDSGQTNNIVKYDLDKKQVLNKK